MSGFQNKIRQVAKDTDKYLHQLFKNQDAKSYLLKPMKYGLFSGGKGFRSKIIVDTGKIFNIDYNLLKALSAAVECVHSYSLIHDDLPCMDDDDLRRGQPTVHKQFDEATAVLAGDALLTLAFEILGHPDTHQDASIRCKLIERLARASGAQGMVGGQMIDMLSGDVRQDLNSITRMQRLKTGALISYAGEAACILGGASDAERQAVHGFTHDLGLAYQIADDLLDVEGDPEIVGKQTQKDEAAGKANFVSILGVDDAKQRVRLLASQAKEHLAIFRNRANLLLQSVDFVLKRQN